jgi:hypothetical protein
MPWRHPESSITDDLPVCNFSHDDVDQLVQHVVKLRTLPEGVLVLSGLSRVWKFLLCDPVLRHRDGTGTGEYVYLSKCFQIVTCFLVCC